MGIQVEFNPDLALRNISEFRNGNRRNEECIPEILEVGKVYPFLKNGQRNYWLYGQIPLIETRGNGDLSRPKASITLLEITHFIENNTICTKGFYRVDEIFKDNEIHFEYFDRVGTRK